MQQCILLIEHAESLGRKPSMLLAYEMGCEPAPPDAAERFEAAMSPSEPAAVRMSGDRDEKNWLERYEPLLPAAFRPEPAVDCNPFADP